MCCQVNLKRVPKRQCSFLDKGGPITVARGWELGGGQSCSPQAPGVTVALSMLKNMGAHRIPLLGGTAGCARAVATGGACNQRSSSRPPQ